MNYILLFKSIAAHLQAKLRKERPEISQEIHKKNRAQMSKDIIEVQSEEAVRIRRLIQPKDMATKAVVLAQMNELASTLIYFKTIMDLSLASYQNGYNGCMEHTCLMFLALHHYIKEEDVVIKMKGASVTNNMVRNHCFLEFYPNKSDDCIIIDSETNNICPAANMPRGTVVYNALHNNAQDITFSYLITSDFIKEVEVFMEQFSSTLFGNISKQTGEFLIGKYKEIIKNCLEKSPWITESNFEETMLTDVYDKALANYKNKNYNLAITNLDKLVPKYSNQHLKLAKTHSLLASSYRDMDDLETAKVHCEQALLLNINNTLRNNIQIKLTGIVDRISSSESRTSMAFS